MVRQRFQKPASDCPNQTENVQKTFKGKRKAGDRAGLWAGIPSLLKFMAISATLSAILYIAYKGYLETRVNTPLSVPKAVAKTGLSDPARFWGTYRSGLYFGLKTRSPADLLTGLMWMLPEKIEPQNVGLRHWCEQGDNLDSYGWKQHDGRNFGVQVIQDRGLQLTTSFVKWPEKSGLEWTARITAETKKKSRSGETVSLFFYAGLDEGGLGDLQLVQDGFGGNIFGSTASIGKFQMEIFASNGTKRNIKHIFHATIESEGPHRFTDSVMQKLRMIKDPQQKAGAPLIGLDPNHPRSDKANLAIYQVVAQLPFQLDVSFTLSDSGVLRKTEADYTETLRSLQQKFDEKFEKTFGLQEKGFNQSSIEFAQAAMSNLVGGIGYFHGHSIVRSDLSDKPVKYWDASLYTAVPSRSFFPRGFLWDEGFHNLLISKWDPEISSDILAHWMDLINVEGWIPREQILGLEARAKVPAEFVIQNNKNANPPTLILTLHSMINDFKRENPLQKIPDWFTGYLNRMWPRLQIWYTWFNSTQTGPLLGTYRWRGRNGSAIHELNPKTLTSGLDDFPRASHPTSDERHVDLRCWMAVASALMADIAKLIGKEKEAVRYEETAKYLYDNQILNDLHWSDEHMAYLDYGLHTEDVVLQRPQVPPHHHGQQVEKVRVSRTAPELQFVNQYGYVGLFPFLLQIIDPSSPKLSQILSDISDPRKLFTPYGLRSLSKDASMYMKKNTEHDAPYWRGPIWININYLAVRALYHYSTVEGPYREQAAAIHAKLKDGIVKNVIKEYQRTGYIWEQYNDKTGQGQGCRPFTGWSTLVVLMMGDRY